jgi:hypothetical protein
MKIQVIKKGTKNAKPQGFCAFMVDEASMNRK